MGVALGHQLPEHSAELKRTPHRRLLFWNIIYSDEERVFGAAAPSAEILASDEAPGLGRQRRTAWCEEWRASAGSLAAGFVALPWAGRSLGNPGDLPIPRTSDVVGRGREDVRWGTRARETTRERTQWELNEVHAETENQRSDIEGCADPA